MARSRTPKTPEVHPLTDRQREVLAGLELLRQACGYSPSIRQLGELLSIRSTNGTAEVLRRLELKGYLTHAPNTARSYRPTPLGLAELRGAP